MAQAQIPPVSNSPCRNGKFSRGKKGFPASYSLTRLKLHHQRLLPVEVIVFRQVSGLSEAITKPFTTPGLAMATHRSAGRKGFPGNPVWEIVLALNLESVGPVF